MKSRNAFRPRRIASAFALATAAVLAGGLLPGFVGEAAAQTKIKWAHVYEVNEPYHKQSVWAAEEIKKLYELFLKVDATQIEINPFVETADKHGETNGGTNEIFSRCSI